MTVFEDATSFLFSRSWYLRPLFRIELHALTWKHFSKFSRISGSGKTLESLFLSHCVPIFILEKGSRNTCFILFTFSMNLGLAVRLSQMLRIGRESMPIVPSFSSVQGQNWMGFPEPELFLVYHSISLHYSRTHRAARDSVSNRLIIQQSQLRPFHYLKSRSEGGTSLNFVLGPVRIYP